MSHMLNILIVFKDAFISFESDVLTSLRAEKKTANDSELWTSN